ncbi:unnamed protein product [Adineta ricciae]|uniref:Uncharacterized protein n=1 Tax=Adineta ricciae TaxID=249248 RepID=A0A815F8J5_ADIRI|nr:unnamed protein product [Adineta ricciae]
MKLSIVRFSGGEAEVPAHIRAKMATSWYVRNFNSFTTRGRANSVLAVIGGWVLFGYTMSKLGKSKKPASPPAERPASSSSSQKKGGHH